MNCDRCTAPTIYSPCGPCQIVAASEDAGLYRQRAAIVLPPREPGPVSEHPELWSRTVIPEPAPDWYATLDPTGTEACQ